MREIFRLLASARLSWRKGFAGTGLHSGWGLGEGVEALQWANMRDGYFLHGRVWSLLRGESMDRELVFVDTRWLVCIQRVSSSSLITTRYV